jgi:hypothetical protein
MWKKREEVSTEIDPEQKYTKTELTDITDAILREDARAELCRFCSERGDETGQVKSMPQYQPDGAPIVDGEGMALALDFPEFECKNGHTWFQGEGKARGIGGDNPILFEEHFQSRRRREIYNQVGVPDPSIVQGQYNRSHPQGRKINTPEQRAKGGASYYR